MAEKPTTIGGGCLCGKLRFTIDFPKDHDFLKAVSWRSICRPNSGSLTLSQTTTCQCWQCRKQSGALVYIAHSVPRSSVTFQSRPTLKHFSASEGFSRGFCSECGGFMYWKEDAGDSISFCVGTFDDDVLQKYGRTLTYGELHRYCKNIIPDVTDNLKGTRYHGRDE